ncbi:hypothetical protein BH10CYA1_BH10CYA1_63530 [soil metagenome]
MEIAMTNEYKTDGLLNLIIESKVVDAENLQRGVEVSERSQMTIGRALSLEQLISSRDWSNFLTVLQLLRHDRISRANAIEILRRGHEKNLPIDDLLIEENFLLKSDHVRLGQFFVDADVMDEIDALNCVELSLQNDKMFGEVAIELGLITPAVLKMALSIQKNIASRAITSESASRWFRQSQFVVNN